MADNLFEEEEEAPAKKESSYLLSIINALQDFQQQVLLWHWNSKAHYHTSTEIAYKALQGPLDGLAESYIAETGKPYEKGEYPKFTATFSVESATAKSKKFIEILNDAADKCKDEGIKGYIGEAINAIRSMYFKF